MGKDVHSNAGMCPWPVGSHLFNDGQNPGEIWGGTVWEQIKEKFPLGCGDTHAAGTSGGEFEHQLTEQELPRVWPNANCDWEGTNNQKDPYWALQMNGGIGDGIGSWPFSSFGGDQPHNNTPPPIWQCTGGTELPECIKGAA